MALRTLIDPIAEPLLSLRQVSGTQWTLRLAGIAGMVLALMGALPQGLFASFMTVLLTLAAGAVTLIQALRPDTGIGVLGPLLVIAALAIQAELSLLRAAAVGLALLLSHAGFALAATLPAHGRFELSAWRLVLRGLLPVVALTAVGAVVVLAAAGTTLGPWMIVLGVLAVIGLLVALMPRPR
ncbi:hypothetical protein H3H54_04590 [Brachybacterium sp. Z12]|uniref:hypothetical protein n=1 Tax=Brachybacterium sp. Z12 TaxID=2759167 RepID=UPI0018618D6C|nr:hypothetical protein [Brachybacterium sp. Z12]QNN83033.1 hypothetical protein H3H54_04590 [Brachybacterium sp. Z12]